MPPDVLLIAMFGSVCGALFHLAFRGRRLRELLTALAIGIIGFAVGHIAARLTDLGLPTIGPLHAIEGFAVGSSMLFVARWLKL
jgi:hypothetical protein